LHQDGYGFYAGFFSNGAVENFGFKAALFCPTQVHPLQHSGPILGIGAASAGMHGQQGVAVVVPARKQQLCFLSFQGLFQGSDLRANLPGERAVVHLIERFEVMDFRGQRLPFLHDTGKVGDALHHLLSGIGVIPEIGAFRLSPEGLQVL